uniref:Uncharacterized protein, isoform D n=1 Tax=Drosophila melanogaster TaxID=7227 RepID=M9PGX4_DROME|nr:uncharacterized protein Dmel_CG32718, isoform D [Drosophila melanogaster]AGB95160.1 uncharacterized protein Dmel_CG32718, isoform D [Drosophila melanogaster]|eukprot:NP_001259315.1 uncharacterized protein Dmel_CG32718, isoform D [Drosophila melanogaster]
MRKMPLGLPIWTPLFILFLLFLAGVWVGVNRNGLLDFYHEQVHGTPLTKKEVECPEDGIMNIKQSRYDRSLNPFKAFLNWPDRHKVHKDDKYKPLEGDLYGHEEPLFDFELTKYQAGAPLVDNRADHFLAQDYKSDFDRKLGVMDHDYPDHFKLNADHFNLDADQFNTVSDRLNQNENHFSLDADQLNRDANQFNVNTNNFNQHRDVDVLDNFQANKPELVNSPMMDYKREFASDEANPYVESLQQRYEPLPHAYKD